MSGEEHGQDEPQQADAADTGRQPDALDGPLKLERLHKPDGRLLIMYVRDAAGSHIDRG